jgi:F-type H+-transporting ATPase subunit b
MEKLISEFSSGLFFWQTLIFVTLIFLLRKFAWKPILDTINEREKSIRDSLNSAKQAKKRNGKPSGRKQKNSARSKS